MKSCKEVSRLVSESMDHKLSVWDCLSLNVHLSMCKLCSGFSRNLKQIREAMRQHADQIDQDAVSPKTTLSPEARARIRKSLDRPEP